MSPCNARGRRGFAVEPLAQGARAFPLAERMRAGREQIEHHPERERVAAGVASVAHHLLGREIGCGADRQAELFRQQVRQLVVPRQSEIDQYRLAALAPHDVCRLEVEMDHMLAVHVVQRRRDPRADVGDGHGIERRAFVKREKGTPRQVLHHDVGLAREIGGGDEARHVRARQPRQDHLLDLEADDRPRALAIGDERDLHEQGLPVRGMRDAPEQGHAAPMQRFNEGEAVDHLAGQKPQHQAPL